jgi:FMN reductase
MTTSGGSAGPILRITTIVGNPRIGSRTRMAAEAVAGSLETLAREQGRAVELNVIELAELAGQLFAYPSEASDATVALAMSSDLLVVASPTYKATYTGLLKAFFDRFGSNGLAGVVAVPVMLGGAPIHMLAVDTHLTPLLLELGAHCPTRGLFILESDLDRLDAVIATWLDANRPILAALLRARPSRS